MGKRKMMRKIFGIALGSLSIVVCLLVAMVPTFALGTEPRGESPTECYTRPPQPDGPPHTGELVRLIPQTGVTAMAPMSESTMEILIVTNGYGPLTGISPIEEKDFWIDVLSEMPGFSVDWYDGTPTFDLLAPYDLVIYDAGGYWYPLSNCTEPLRQYHFSGKSLIVVTPDINFDWQESVPDFCRDVLHIEGVLGILPEAVYDIFADTGHEIVYGIPKDVPIGVPAVTSWPDCFDPMPNCDGVLRQGYIPQTEFGVGTCSELPSYSEYDPEGKLFAAVAYPGSATEGRSITYGVPISGIENILIAKQLARSSIEWALEKEIVDIDLTLRVEDASPNCIVSKAPGDKVDIVAVVKNKEDTKQTVDVELAVPAILGDPEKTSIRKDFSPASTIQEICPGTLTVRIDLDPLDPESSRQIVWGFKISDEAKPQDITVDARVKGIESDSRKFRVVDNAKAIIVTNRYLLYDNYASGEVKSLLSYLYEISEAEKGGKKGCIVYYVDHENDSLENWNPSNVPYDDFYDNNDLQEEQIINSEAILVDKLIGNWVTKTKPNYLMIVGDDRVIPMYRMDDPSDKVHCEETIPILGICKEPRTEPPLFVNGYYFTDVPYADTDGEWRKGDTELAIGRIVGVNAKDMENLIRRGIRGNNEKANNAIVATHLIGQQKPSLNVLKKKFSILREEELVGKTHRKETKTVLMEVLKNSYSVCLYSGHGGRNFFSIGPKGKKGEVILCCEAFLGSEYLTNPYPYLEKGRPFLYFLMCEGGAILPTDDSTADNGVYAAVRAGASSIIAPTVTAHLKLIGSAAGERLTDKFFQNLFKDGEKSTPIGEALRKAKAEHKPFWWRAADTETVTGFHLYGVPWEVLDPPDKANNQNTNTQNQGYAVDISAPSLVTGKTYEVTISVNVTDYEVITTEQGFEIISILGSLLSEAELEPVIPFISIPIVLPAKVGEINLEKEYYDSKFMGYYNVPSTTTTITTEETPIGKIRYVSTDFTDKTDGVIGFYPEPTYSVDISPLDGYRIVNVSLALAQFDPETKAVNLCDSARLKLTYQAPIPLVITDFSTDKTEYATGEPINASVTVENVGSETLSALQANLSLKDHFGEILASASSSEFNLSPGESKTISILLTGKFPDGTYLAEIEIVGSGVLGSSSKYIHILSGDIIEFSLPEEVIQGEDITFGISFENKDSVGVEATGAVYVYDGVGIKLAELPSNPITVGPHSTALINITWSTLGKELGEYAASAMVFAHEKTFGPTSDMFTIRSPNQPPVADAGPDQTVYVTPPATTAMVTLNGSSSYDPDGDSLTYTWTWDGNTASGVNPTIELPLGTTTITLVVNDGELLDSDTVDITVEQRAAPPAPAVGGEAYPPNKLAVLAPWLALAMFLIGGISWFTLRRRRTQS